MLGLTAVLAAVISLPLTASAATHARSTQNASPHPVAVACGHDYLATNGSCVVDLAAIGAPFSYTPNVAIVHIGPRAQSGVTLDAEIDPDAVEIVASSGSPSTVARYVVQQLQQDAAAGDVIRVVVTVGGTKAVSPSYNRAIASAVVPAATVEVGGANAVDGTIALADSLQLYQRGGVVAVRENIAGLADIAATGYGPLLWPASR